jgi:hypothetical protein
MSSSDPRSWLDRFVGTAFGLLVASIAVFVAVHLIEAVWVVLVVIAVAVLAIGVVVALLRARARRW